MQKLEKIYIFPVIANTFNKMNQTTHNCCLALTQLLLIDSVIDNVKSVYALH